MNHCHANKIAHRDLKPENIMYAGSENSVKIIDFGLSKREIVPAKEDPQQKSLDKSTRKKKDKKF